MNKTKVMINGLPGNVAKVIARHAMADERIEVLPFALTGPEIDFSHCHIQDLAVELIRPENSDEKIKQIIRQHSPFISVDYTHPTAVNANAEFYGRYKLPFVMGTTGGDREKLAQTVRQTGNIAIIAPNMAKQIVGFQAMMAYAAENFPDIFKGYGLTIKESHQAGKADTSGTAKAMVQYFNQMGVPFSVDQIEKERDPERQANMWGVPEPFLAGHAWHTYTLTSADGTVRFEFVHNINGREIYGEGTMDAVCFLSDKISRGETDKVYSMIDVLRKGAS